VTIIGLTLDRVWVFPDHGVPGPRPSDVDAGGGSAAGRETGNSTLRRNGGSRDMLVSPGQTPRSCSSTDRTNSRGLGSCPAGRFGQPVGACLAAVRGALERSCSRADTATLSFNSTAGEWEIPPDLLADPRASRGWLKFAEPTKTPGLRCPPPTPRRARRR
jgi:hypothetical protein